AMEYFSATRYPTIAFICSLMKAMKSHYALNIDLDNDDLILNSNVPNYDSESENSTESSDLSDIKIQTDIYNSLFEYWDNPLKICHLATLLDPWLKKMTFASKEVCNDTINECWHQLQLIDIQIDKVYEIQMMN
ncbi:19255_t:CDS:2, partial [Dentiscutata erythropus]